MRAAALAWLALQVIAAAAAQAPYVLGPGDQITIRALDAEEISDKPFTIDSSGSVNLPMVGRVQASGLTVPQFEAALTDKLHKYIWNPHPTVTVTDFHSQPVSVIGAVNIPGVVQLRGEKTLIEVLSMAGGLRTDAGSRVTIQRESEQPPIALPGAKLDSTGRYMVAEVNLRSIMDNAHPEENIAIEPHDVISVPRADMIFVVGEVHKSGGFLLNERSTMSVLQALSLAEGLESTAAPAAARILRGSGENRAEIPVDVKRILTGKIADVSLHADDILFIPSSLPKKAAIRTIEAAIQMGTGYAIWR